MKKNRLRGEHSKFTRLSRFYMDAPHIDRAKKASLCLPLPLDRNLTKRLTSRNKNEDLKESVQSSTKLPKFDQFATGKTGHSENTEPSTHSEEPYENPIDAKLRNCLSDKTQELKHNCQVENIFAGIRKGFLTKEG